MNNYVQKLFPYLKIFNNVELLDLNDYVNIAFVTILQLSALFFTTRFIFKYLRIRGKLNLVQIKTAPAISIIWEQYNSTFNTLNKTEFEASYFFNYRNVFNRLLNLRFYETLPNLFIGAGILGTFVGLTLGISNFDTSSTESIKDSINLLLSGMATAFVTSVWGMFLSISINAIEKISIRNISKQLSELCLKLDKQNIMSELDLIKYRQAEIRSVFNEYMTTKNNEGKTIYLINLIHEAQQNLEQQTGALKSFSTDLADGIRISSETVIALGDKIGDIFSATLEREFKPILNSLNDSVSELRETKEESAGKFVEDMVQKLEASIGNLVNNVQQSISGNTMSYFENLASTISTFINTLEGYPQTMQQLMTNFSELLDAQKDNLKNTSSQVSEEMMTSMNIVKQEFENTVGIFKEQVNELSKRIEHIQTTQDTGTAKFNNLLSKSHDIIQEFNEGADRLNEFKILTDQTLEQIRQASSVFRDVANENKHASITLNNTSTNLSNQLNLFVEHFKDSTEQYTQFMNSSKSLIDKFKDESIELSESISNVFEQLDKGMNQYTEITRDQLNKSLAEFTNQFANSAGSLKEAVNYLQDIIDELNDTLENFNKR